MGRWLAALAVIAVAAAWWLRSAAPPVPPAPPLTVAGLLAGGDTAGFRRALAPHAFAFPRDHGPHPGYRTEWWYLTGHLVAREGGKRYGFQLTFFRNALAPDAPERESAWAARDVWLAHFALTDVDAGAHRAFERWGRGAAGIAGAIAAPQARVWLDDWVFEHRGGDRYALAARAAGAALSLELTARKPPALHGERGLSRKGASAGNASHYYSLSRLDARGSLALAGTALDVEGRAWLDREWSTSALEPDQAGWDWLALQFDDGHDLMLYRMRRADSGIDAASSGSWIAPDGRVRVLARDDVEMHPVRHWRSPATGVRYPIAWRIRIPALGLELETEALLDDQEMRLAVRYWEGAVAARARLGGRPLSGYGYLELTGYGDAAGETERGARGG